MLVDYYRMLLGCVGWFRRTYFLVSSAALAGYMAFIDYRSSIGRLCDKGFDQSNRKMRNSYNARFGHGIFCCIVSYTKQYFIGYGCVRNSFDEKKEDACFKSVCFRLCKCVVGRIPCTTIPHLVFAGLSNIYGIRLSCSIPS